MEELNQPALPRVYIETSFVSYLASRPSRDLVVAGHQLTTRDWWNGSRLQYENCLSQLVLDEAGAGDPQAAADRLAVLRSMSVLETTQAALDLAAELLREGALPEKAADDAVHVSVAAVHAIPYLLTWNCRHLANATMRPVIESVCAAHGYVAPVICTPEQLLRAAP